ncbi:hypothetical protein ACWV95_03835 [Streptomyces albus]
MSSPGQRPGSASPAELHAMRRAARLAATALGSTSPNPVVGCVLLGEDGAPVAEGHHLGAGHPHAEVEALKAAGPSARGATAVVTLEPCAHQGRTGPCADALLEAGVTRASSTPWTTPPPRARVAPNGYGAPGYRWPAGCCGSWASTSTNCG